MYKYRTIKIAVLLVIICVGTYALTSSLSITVGVAILMFVIDRVVGAWADKKDKEYFYNGNNNDNDGEAN